MNQVQCPNCGTTYDVSAYSPGHKFTCTCGRELEVGAPSAAVSAGVPPPATLAARGVDPGMQPIVKVLVFFANLCFSPLAALISTIVYFVIREQKPRTARDLCQMTWIPFLLAVVLWCLYIFFFVGMATLGSLRNM